MTEELTTTEEQIETEPVETEEAAPSQEDIVKEWLKAQGVDPNEFDPKKVASLSKWERDLNKKSSELGAIAKQLETAPKNEQPEVEFDPNELKNLEAALKAIGIDPKKVASSVTLAEQAVRDELAETADEFFTAHKDVPSEDIVQSLMADGIDLDNITPARLKRELTRAYKVIKADTLDIDKLVQEQVEKKLAELKGGDEVVSVKKGRASSVAGHKTADDVMGDESLSFFDKMDILGKL